MSKKHARATSPEQTETPSAETVETTPAPNLEAAAQTDDTVRVHYTDETGNTKSVDVGRGAAHVDVDGGHLAIMWGEYGGSGKRSLLSATFVPTPAEPTESAGRRYIVIDVTGAQEERIAALLTESGATMIAPDLPATPRALVALIECLDLLSPIADSLLGAAKDALARKIGTGKTVQIGGRKAYAAKMSGKARRHEWTMRYEAEREAMDLD